MGCESIHGEVQVQLDAVYQFDPKQRTGRIDASTAVGRDLNRLFLGFLQREYGQETIRVERSASTTLAGK
jgi:hypothetical protein